MHKAQVSTKLIETLQERFRSFDEKIMESMKWFDPKILTIEKDFGEDQIALILMFLRSELNGNRSNAMSNLPKLVPLILYYITPDDFTHQGRASGWERVNACVVCTTVTKENSAAVAVLNLIFFIIMLIAYNV